MMDAGKRKIIAIALVAVLAVAAVAAVLMLSGKGDVLNGGDNGAPFNASVTDASGTNVTISEPPRRIVSGAPMISEIVAGLGLTDRLVAVTDYCDYPAAITVLRNNGSTIGGFYTPSYEKVISFNPDMIILDNGVQAQIDMASQLRGAGYTVILLHAASDLESVYKNIDMVGKATGTQAVGEPMIAKMKAQVKDIADAVASERKPNIMFVTYADEGFTNVMARGGTTSTEIIECPEAATF